MTVRAILDAKGRQVESIGADAKVSSAVKILSERRIGALLVMAGDRIEGIMSERDIVRELGERGAKILDDQVSTVMTPKVMTCRRADTVSWLMEQMTEGKFRHLPVVEDGQVVGIVSIGDVVKHRVMEFEREQEAMRDYIETAEELASFRRTQPNSGLPEFGHHQCPSRLQPTWMREPGIRRLADTAFPQSLGFRVCMSASRRCPE